jgi:hypothetical protein
MAAGPEPEVVREYRHLLRTASTDWAETAHRHALTTLGPTVRTEVHGEVRRLLLTGYRFGPDDVHAVARVLVLAERRSPRTLLDGLPAELLRRLAAAVVSSPTGRMLRAGIDVWDGTEPPGREAPLSEGEGGEPWGCTEFGTAVASPDIGTAWTGIPPPTLRRP